MCYLSGFSFDGQVQWMYNKLNPEPDKTSYTTQSHRGVEQCIHIISSCNCGNYVSASFKALTWQCMISFINNHDLNKINLQS